MGAGLGSASCPARWGWDGCLRRGFRLVGLGRVLRRGFRPVGLGRVLRRGFRPVGLGSALCVPSGGGCGRMPAAQSPVRWGLL